MIIHIRIEWQTMGIIMKMIKGGYKHPHSLTDTLNPDYALSAPGHFQRMKRGETMWMFFDEITKDSPWVSIIWEGDNDDEEEDEDED